MKFHHLKKNCRGKPMDSHAKNASFGPSLHPVWALVQRRRRGWCHGGVSPPQCAWHGGQVGHLEGEGENWILAWGFTMGPAIKMWFTSRIRADSILLFVFGTLEVGKWIESETLNPMYGVARMGPRKSHWLVVSQRTSWVWDDFMGT